MATFEFLTKKTIKNLFGFSFVQVLWSLTEERIVAKMKEEVINMSGIHHIKDIR